MVAGLYVNCHMFGDFAVVSMLEFLERYGRTRESNTSICFLRRIGAKEQDGEKTAIRKRNK